jgi:hypothetical protein
MRDNTVVRKHPDIVTRVIAEETILLPVVRSSEEINAIYTLNASAALVWQLIDGKRTVGDLKRVILQRCETTPDGVDQELAELLKDFKEIRVIE